jgi:hypothetical protein
MYLTTEHFTKKKVKEIVDIAETKIKRFETKIQSHMTTQDKDLDERIKRRKMRS